MSAQEIESAILSAILLNELGFQPLKQSNLLQQLKSTSCTGCTLLRDAIVVGNQLMLSLWELLMKLGSFRNYHFVNVVLTDGGDTGSKASVIDLQTIFALIGKAIPAKALTTHFIGVEMSYSDSQQLKSIASFGQENAHFHLASDTGLETIFAKIVGQIKQERSIHLQGIQVGGFQAVSIQQRANPYLELEIMKYVVLFTLDRSGSMSGSRWTKVCQCVENFIKIMGNTDLVGGIVFNDKVEIITKAKTNNVHKPQLTYTSPSSQPQYRQSQKKQKQCQCMDCRIF